MVMEELNNSVSVYELTTKLCEKLLNSRRSYVSDKITRKLRSKAYEILLSKKLPEKVDLLRLDDIRDPFCHLLAWQYVLINNYNLSEHAKKIQDNVELLQKYNALTNTVLNDVLILLVQLKQIPSENMRVNTTIWSNNFNTTNFRQFEESDFKLPFPMICSGSKYSDESFYLKTKRNIKRCRSSHLMHFNLQKESCLFPNRMSCKSLNNLSENEKNVTAEDIEDEDIWEVVSKMKFTDHRTWETLGNTCPETEPPFLTEARPKICNLIYDYQFLKVNLLNDSLSNPRKIVAPNEFIRHVKFLIVGIPSESFKYNDDDRLTLVPGTCVEGLSCTALESYCKDLIFCGTCYKALNQMCAPNQSVLEKNKHGFIFRELCESIKRYLSFYRIASQSISANSHLLSVHEHMRKLHAHLDVLASVCKVGPFTESEQLPNGVALLNYLYEKVTSLSNEDVVMVLYSVLYPCVQVYFSRFLQQWIFEGIINDPFNEFFIYPIQKYLNTHGRTYWTRSYKIQEDIVPDFLFDLRNDIFLCGKSMNLLKYCTPSSPLCVYLMGKKPTLLSCCLTSDQLTKLEQNATCYYLEAIAECGQRFTFADLLTRSDEQNITFLNLVTKKRAVTLKRLALEKLKKVQEEHDRKQLKMAKLRMQYDIGVQQKKAQLVEEIEREMKINEVNLQIQSLREKIVQEEANKLIEYYNNLFEIVEKKRIRIENYTKQLKNVADVSEEPIILLDTFKMDKTTSSNESFCTVSSDPPQENEDDAEESAKELRSSESLDIINANSDEVFTSCHENVKPVSQAAENFEAARRNRAKVMSVEMGYKMEVDVQKPVKIDTELSALQKNRQKMMSSGFGIDVKAEIQADRELTIVEINKRKNMMHTEFGSYFQDTVNEDVNKNEPLTTLLVSECDNENFINSNVDVIEVNGNFKATKTDLKLDFSQIDRPSIFSKFLKSPNFEFDKSVPMSIDSTPCTEMSSSLVKTESQLTTAATNFTDDGFSFSNVVEHKPIQLETMQISKRMSMKDAAGISTSCLKLFIQQSVSIPVRTQTELANNELLKYFINDLQYLTHLNSLRSYFFLLDGEFGRNITEGLFEKLYDANLPVDLINCRTLCHLVYHAIDSSIKFQETSNLLSFKINELPKKFDLGSPDVLDCLSLTYKVTWPLNILLSTDTIGKYDEVFKFLLKLHRVSWVLKKIFQELKILTKKTGKREPFLMLSPEFLKLHQRRHVMTHFIQTLQNYVVGEVLQTSWNIFEKNLVSVTNLDELYSLHTTYIKDILFMCLLNQKSAQIRKVINKIFIIILKFYDYLRMKEWEFDEDDGVYVHPNFKRLEDIFLNFEEFVFYLYKAGQKIAKAGCQPHLVQLLDMLNVNDYYTKKTMSC